ncbi:MAG: cell division protein FtsQ/DivIB [Solirubrobacterales bacterium]
MAKPKPRRRSSATAVWRRRLAALATIALALAAGYFFWLRNSSLFEVREVEVSGATANAPEVAAALQEAARGMTTLHIRDQELRDAVSGFPTIASLKAQASVPHKLEIEVTERLPVALVKQGGATTPVSADGYLLRGVEADPGLPLLEPSQPLDGARLGARDIEQAALLGAVPDQLRKGIETSRFDPDQAGVVVELSNGIELRLGDSSEAAAKWAAAAAVLADRKLGSPAYIDVSVPGRPVAGGYSG